MLNRVVALWRLVLLIFFNAPTWLKRRHVIETDASWEVSFAKLEKHPRSLRATATVLWFYSSAVKLRDPRKIVRAFELMADAHMSIAQNPQHILIALEAAIWIQDSRLKSRLWRLIGVCLANIEPTTLRALQLLDSWRTHGSMDGVRNEDCVALKIPSHLPWIWELFGAAVCEHFGRDVDAEVRYRTAYQMTPRSLPESSMIREKLRLRQPKSNSG